MVFPFFKKFLQTVPMARSWFRISEPFTGAWQRNIEWKRKDILCYNAVFACITLIASDISKLGLNLVRNDDGIWSVIGNTKYKVLEKPNTYQNRIQFIEAWVLSKLIRGNAYILKQRNSRGDVIGMHVLHPDRVLPMVSDDGDVFYQLSSDNLSGISETGITVPASEIIHDRYNCFFHPLVGLSPLFAAGLPAFMGMKILENSAKHFSNGARPSGILTVPEAIDKEKANELSERWQANYGGDNYGKVAVLGGDVKYQAITMTAVESQMIEQVRMTAEMVCSAFHVPPYKIGSGQLPSYNNVEALNVEYYNSGLQSLIEQMELCLDEGLDMPAGTGTEFDIDDLLRMDAKSQIETLGAGVDKAIYSSNEARRRMNLKPVDGGDTPMLQQQMWPIDVLSKRNAQELIGQSPSDEGIVNENIQQEALNGAQVTALQNIIFAVANGSLPKETARALIAAAFPVLTESQIDDMLKNAEDIKPEPGESEEEVRSAVAHYFMKALNDEK